jgi:hypothetical protein
MSYKENHYVPCWYQERFLPTSGERKFRYLDLKPEIIRDDKGRPHTKKALFRWGATSCFKETDLYTVQYGQFESTDIEKFFFGRVDDQGRKAIEFFTNYNGFDKIDGDPKEAFHGLLNYMSIQRFRTPKGLKYLSSLIKTTNKNLLLIAMQELQDLHCAIWTECVWSIVDANHTRTKFIVSDHPITLYNREVFPDSETCRSFTDPDFRMNGTHTLFPLSPTRILILTNLSWVRNPYGGGTKLRPNPKLFRSAMFNFTAIHTGRELDEVEVNQINFIIKRRAERFIAAAQEEWLYPEKAIPSTHWRKLDDLYLLMPDPRPIHMGGEIILGYEDGQSTAFDEYGRRPWQKGYSRETKRDTESKTLYAFKGEFARLFGRKHRGTSFELGRRIEEDSEAYHQHLLEKEKRLRPAGLRPRKDMRSH